ncbi:carboxypeptidase regulatory-like domain-containing protein [Shewanella marina]|uniref:carboxypeptidase regulatory-like domain-containing protein n=1 Tax=Shewanella marina TaxID=487319 RepID=UPI00068601AB|nr:carboxypeptidase regulatory-like domain-containing protein [Shewanella marina]
MADRWLISQFALDGTDNHECIAISQTGDPTGAYFLYDFPYGELMNDYPHLGVWTDGYYMGVNQFDPSNNFAWAGGGVVAYERDKMLIGAEAQQVIFSMQGNDPEVFTPMPLDIDGVLLPNATQKQLFVWADGEGESKLHVWQFDVDWDNTADASFTAVTELTVAEFNGPANAVQPNGVELDSLGIRSMFRAAYRKLPNRSSIIFTHNVAGADGNTPAVRWYELDLNETANEVTVRQQGTYAPDDQARWMVSGAIDAVGNIALGYSLTSDTKHPSVFAATRLVDDPLGELSSEIELKAGGGSQQAINRGRWGDYSSMSVDPADDCTFWYTTEYYKAEDDNTLAWSTNISSFKIPTCVAGPSGTIMGTVTDADSGDAIANVTVTLGNASAVTDTEGNYTVAVPVGSYTPEFSRYGWVTLSASEVAVEDEAELTINQALQLAPRVAVTGTVKDGGTANWPLYADVKVNVPGDVLQTYTNPETGMYSIELVEGTAVEVSATAMMTEGYIKQSAEVTPAAGVTSDFAMPLNPNCTAPGYAFDEPSFKESFEGDFVPEGWVTEALDGTTVTWVRSDSTGRGNVTKTDGHTALIDSDDAGFVDVNSVLISPAIAVDGLVNNTLTFVANHRTYTGADSLNLDIQVDNGDWQTIQTLDKSGSSFGSLTNYEIDLSSYIDGATAFKLRWHYFDANYEWYAAVDDVIVGTPSCNMLAGNLVAGYIRDANLDTPVHGANVVADEQAVITSITTEHDDQLEHGFVYGFIPSDAQMLNVKASNYSDKEVNAGHFTLATPVVLDAGLFEADTVAISVTAGRSVEDELVVRNTGKADVDYRLLTLPVATDTLPNGPFHASARHFGPKNLNEINTDKIRYFPDVQAAEMAVGDYVTHFELEQGFGWGITLDRENDHIWVADLVLGGASADQLVEYDAEGTVTGEMIATPYVAEGGFGADLAYNPFTQTYWQVAVGGDNCIHEISLADKVATGNKICPSFSTSQRGLAYDPLTDTFYAGSWNDSVIHQFKTDSEIIRSINVDLGVAGLAFNSGTGHLFVSDSGGSYDIFVLDTNTELLDLVGGYHVNLDSDGDGENDLELQGTAGLDIDCKGNLWAVDQTSQTVLAFSSGETGVCDWSTVPWLTVNEDTGSLAMETESKVGLMIDTSTTEVGEHNATVLALNNTPYGNVSVPVTLTVTAPEYGSVAFSPVDVSVRNGATAQLTVTRTDGSDYAISVDYQFVDGTAKNGEHYNLTGGTLTWEDMDSSSKTISVPTVDLPINEDVSFSVLLSNPSNATIGGADVAVVKVTQDPRDSGGALGGISLLLLSILGIRRKLKYVS